MSILVFAAFTMVSISSMFPNNAFMNSHEYFYYKLRNVTEDDFNVTTIKTITPMQSEFEAYLMVFGGFACVLGSILNVVATKSLSNTVRVMIGHAMVLVVFLPTIALTYADTDEYQELFFSVSLLLMAIACFGSLGLMAGGVLGLSALFPAKYTQAVMVGQSTAGVLAAVMSIVCQAATPNVVVNGRVYFFICVVWTVASIFVFIHLTRVQRVHEANPLLLEDEEDFDVAFDEDTRPEHLAPVTIEPNIRQQTIHVLQEVKTDLVTISVILIVTLSAYPALSSLVKSTSRNHIWNEYFSSVTAFLLYNIGDLIGRCAANTIPMNRRALLAVSVARSLLIPLIAACNVQPRSHTHALLPYDGVFILLVFLLAFTHGFCITNATIRATKAIDENSRELAGSVTSLVGVTAALVGALIGVLVLKLI